MVMMSIDDETLAVFRSSALLRLRNQLQMLAKIREEIYCFRRSISPNRSRCSPRPVVRTFSAKDSYDALTYVIGFLVLAADLSKGRFQGAHSFGTCAIAREGATSRALVANPSFDSSRWMRPFRRQTASIRRRLSTKRLAITSIPTSSSTRRQKS